MARALRKNIEGGWYHITARGHNRQAIFLDDGDRTHWRELLAESVERFRMEVHAYVCMDNHYHLLIRTPEANVSRAIQWLNTSYGIWWNRRHGQCGGVFQGRFKGVLVEHGAWVVEASLYLHLNPVAVAALALDKAEKSAERRGLRPAPSVAVAKARLGALRRHAWSSYPAYGGYARAPEWLTTAEIWRRAGGRNKYRELVERRVRAGREEALWSRLHWGLVLGGEAFAEMMRKGLKVERETAGRRILKRWITWEDLVKAVENVHGGKWVEFCDRHGDWGRDVALWAGRKYGGLSLREAGEKVGGLDYVTVSVAVRRVEQRATQDRTLQAALTKMSDICKKKRYDP